MGQGGAGRRSAASAGECRGVVDRRPGLRGGGSEAAQRDGGGPVSRARYARAGGSAEGRRGRGGARVAATGRRGPLLPRRPGRARGGERAGREIGRREAVAHQRRAGCDGGGGRAHPADPVGAHRSEDGGLAGQAHRRGVGSGLVIRFDAVTLFPETFSAISGSGITARALQAGLWRLQTWNPRDFTTDNYRTVDDRPYGGGPGMVMLAEPREKALDAAQAAGAGRVIYLSPQGTRLDHRKVMALS